MKYNPSEIEKKWQSIWEQEKVFEVPNDLAVLKQKPKYYVLDMFPYPSGAGLHVGHPEGYTATDVMARMKRMQGYNVLHPMGWDAFGLPAERAAMRENIHPQIITERNVKNFKRQINRLGFSYDWNREINTSDKNYYKFTQWIFLQLYKKDLAYLSEVPVNWCPALGTVLANEEVKDGKYVETGDPVERRLMKQWMLKITEYAERLLSDLDRLDWPENVKEMQRNWIGKSTGAEIDFKIDGHDKKFRVYTTRHDTIFGVTFCLLAPEHPLVSQITTNDYRNDVEDYVKYTLAESEIARTEVGREKTGVFTGAYALHPITGERVPVWIADYVLKNYGTGAVMGVPAHCDRDYEFAKKYSLPIKEVVTTATGAQLLERESTENVHLVNSDFLNGLSVEIAKERVIQELSKRNCAQSKVQYRLRDWLFSRQRYWGEPFPLIHLDDGTILTLENDQLPVELPKVDEYRPTDDGMPPLGRAGDSWVRVKLPDGRMGSRELNTMPQWAGSCWYYLRYLDPHNQKEFCSKELENYWMPVDLYIGGVEHAVLHLLYARFWHKVLYDCGVVHTKEPFQKLFNQGFILGKSYRDQRGKYYHFDDVEEKDGKSFVKSSGVELVSQVEKMSKSKLNVVNPDDVVDEYGADAMRLYELFMGPLEQVKMWQMAGVEGVYRFLERTWRLVIDSETGELSKKLSNDAGNSDTELWVSLHKTIKKVTEDTEGLRFNTAISQMMTFVNEATGKNSLSRETIQLFLRLLCPYAPHMCHELYNRLGMSDMLMFADWPQFDPALCVDDQVTMGVQINGKRRDEIVAKRGSSDEEIKKLVLEAPQVKKFLGDVAPKRIIVIKDKIINIVV